MKLATRERINEILSGIEKDYPRATETGLRQPDRNTPPGLGMLFNSDTFNQQVQHCLDWLRDKNLSDSKIKSFNHSCPSSYGFKHIVERDIKKKGVHDNYILNMAFIVAMLIAGFEMKPAGLYAQFNISKQALKEAGVIERDN